MPDIIKALSTAMVDQSQQKRDVTGPKRIFPREEGYPRTVVFRRKKRRSIPVPLEGRHGLPR